jgi:hypothetical protein
MVESMFVLDCPTMLIYLQMLSDKFIANDQE